MPKQFSRKRAASEEYENDGGFVEDAPKNKKTKAASASEVKSKTSTKSNGSETEYWEVSELTALECRARLTWQIARTYSSHPAE